MAYMEIFGYLVATALGAKIAYNIGCFVYTTFLCRLLGHGIDVSKCGPWAVVTGATDGIGKSYALSLAKAGLNVVLVSRTPAKLRDVADEIKSAYNSVQVKTIAVDFTESQSIYAVLKSELSRLEIGFLVNNVGMAVGFAEPFSDIDDRSLHDLINCNVMSMVRMCHIVLPQMIERKSGVIVNIGSLSGVFATPMATVYGATKAFVDKFSRDLAAEVRSCGVVVQTVHPGYVATKMTKLKRTMTVPDPDTFVAAALSTLGLEGCTAGFWFHKIFMYFGENASFFLRGFWEVNFHKMMEIRRVELREASKSE